MSNLYILLEEKERKWKRKREVGEWIEGAKEKGEEGEK